MTMRDELERVMATVSDGYSDPDEHYAAKFLRDHGPALLEALEDADRFEFICNGDDESWQKAMNYAVLAGRLEGIQQIRRAIDRARGGGE